LRVETQSALSVTCDLLLCVWSLCEVCVVVVSMIVDSVGIG